MSVVFATRERPRRLAALIDALAAQTIGGQAFEAIAVDDSSRDETPAVLQEACARPDLNLRVITRAESGGAAAARDDGWRAARAPVVAFTDDDCEPAPDWLAAGLEVCRRHGGDIVQGLTAPQPRELDALGPFSRTLEIRELGPYFQTCNIFYPRELLEALDGFDAATYRGVGGEDTDLAWRALDEGREAHFAPAAVVYHAVEDLGVAGHLRLALRWSDTMAMFRHPEVRAAVLHWDLFWKDSHAKLPAAALGLALARRFPPALMLAWPYVGHIRWRLRATGAGKAVAPYFVLHDLLEIYAAVRGAVRHRVLVI